jgi:FtsP/CotA-like multicopper oxidase with cupredoxin domain
MIKSFLGRAVSRRWAGAALAVLLGSPTAAFAADFVEPPVFASANGVLDLLMIAKPAPVTGISFAAPGGNIHPTGWVYEICRRALASSANNCPSGSATVAPYGGVRLALQKGDSLKVRLVNRLPTLDPVKVDHSGDPGGGNLPLNLTNLHTHGLIVQARAPTVADPTFGDDVFVEIYNSANGTPVPQASHQHGSIVKDYADYRIDIPANHPSGQFWFHPHVHGLALNQVSSGLSGIISIGEAGDYVFGDIGHARFPDDQVRHLVLKDMQVLAAGSIQFGNGTANVVDGEVLNQQDPGFCNQFPAGPAEPRQGSCPGADNSSDDGNNYVGGRWFFTVSGQDYPTIRITKPDGELWRLTNASGSASYDLQLTDDATRRPMVMQLVSVDGVSIKVPPETTLGAMVALGGARFRIVACPASPKMGLGSAPVCIDQFAMMPSSRAEVWVTYRDAAGRITSPPTGATATLKTLGLATGPAGDSWPAVDLARVEFAQPPSRDLTAFALDVRGDAYAANLPTGIFNAPVPYARPAPLPASCKALPEGHRRRIFFGLADPFNDAASFGLGYEEVDRNGVVVPGSQMSVSRFDPSNNTICLPLGPGQRPVHETWELVNLALENHNFHIHQTKFRLVQAGSHGGPLSEQLDSAAGAGIMEDNVPLPVSIPHTTDVLNNQNGYCTVAQWHNGQCTSAPVIVDIPFSQLGEFVFHCHILEHEDGGMMAKIQVVPSAY